MMSKEEIEAEANGWIRSQGLSEETLPSDEYNQMVSAYVAGHYAGWNAKADDINKMGLCLQSDMDKTIKQNFELKARLNAINLLTPELEKQSKVKKQQLTKAKEIIEELSKSLFLAKGIVRDLIDDTVDFKESKERAIYCYEQESFDTYKEAVQFLKEVSE